jgi:hypothetical protein
MEMTQLKTIVLFCKTYSSYKSYQIDLYKSDTDEYITIAFYGKGSNRTNTNILYKGTVLASAEKFFHKQLRAKEKKGYISPTGIKEVIPQQS